MVYKHENYKNGYIFAKSSTDKELQEILDTYEKLNVIFCNSNTIKNFKKDRTLPITINNKLNDGCFFINQMI